MAVINDLGFPFSSVSGDRQYSSSEWREYFNALFDGGVVGGADNELGVKPQAVANKSIYIDTGTIIIQGAMRKINTTQDLIFTDNTSGSTRIDRVVARINFADRKIEFVVKEGTTVAPALTRDSTFYELSLAKVTLANGYSTITATEITDERSDETLCGYISNTFLEVHKANLSNPHAVTKTQVGLGSVENYGIATQAEAEAGTSDLKYMTPLKTTQFGDKLVANGFYTASVIFPESSTTTITVPLGGAFTSVSGAVEALHGFSFTVGTTQSQSIFTANSGAMGSRVTIGAIATAYDTVYIDIGVSSMYISGTDLIINCNSVRTSSITETISIRWEALK